MLFALIGVITSTNVPLNKMNQTGEGGSAPHQSPRVHTLAIDLEIPKSFLFQHEKNSKPP